MKKITQKVILLLLTFSFVLPYVNISAEDTAYASEKLNNLMLTEPYSLGTAIPDLSIRNGTVGVEDGYDMLYTSSSGEPCYFNVYNLDTRTLERTYPLPKTTQVWTHEIGKDGNVYIGTTSRAYLFRYSPVTKQLENLGDAIGEMTAAACWEIEFDEDNNVYIGAYPTGTIVKYDQTEKTFTHIANPDPESKYVHSLAYYKGKLYAGTVGDGTAGVYIVDAKTGECKPLEIPQREGYTTFSQIYTMTVQENFLFIHAYKSDEEDAPVMLIYNLDTEKFCDAYAMNSISFYASPPLNGKIYIAADGFIQEFDINTEELIKTDIPFAKMFRGSGWVDVEEEGFVGKSLATVQYTGEPVLINIETGKIKIIEDAGLKGGGAQIHNIAANPYNNKIHVGGYIARNALVYDPESNTAENYKAEQTEGMIATEKSMYYGIYPYAYIFTTPTEYEGEAPDCEIAFKIEDDQDRPFGTATGDGKLFFGTVPGYGKKGGAISIYDEATGELETIRGVVGDYSVIALEYKDGKLYGGTSISPGLGIPFVADEAELFVFDVNTKKVIKEKIPDFPDDMLPGSAPMIGGLAFGPDGLLWCAVYTYLFAVDPETLEIKKQVLLREMEGFGGGPHYRKTFLHFGEDGLLYAANDGLYVVDTETLEFIALNDVSETLALDNDGNIYTAGNVGELTKITKINEPIASDARAEVDGVLNDSIVLKSNYSMANSHGIPKKIDPISGNVVPVVKNGRTLVPLRFITENMNGEVLWDEEAKRVTVWAGGRKIELVVGEKEMKVDGVSSELDVPAEIIDGRTMVPIRALFEEGLGKYVYYTDNGIIIISNKSENITSELSDNLRRYFKYYIESEYYEYQTNLEEEIKKEEEEKISKYLLPVQNAGFELVSDNAEVLKWEPLHKKSTETKYYLSADRAKEGEYSLCIEDDSEVLASGIQSWPVEVIPGKYFTARADLYIAEGRTGFLVRFYDGRMNIIREETLYVSTGVGGWQELDITLTVPENAIVARVICNCSPLWTTKAYYDNIRVYQYDGLLQ